MYIYHEYSPGFSSCCGYGWQKVTDGRRIVAMIASTAPICEDDHDAPAPEIVTDEILARNHAEASLGWKNRYTEVQSCSRIEKFLDFCKQWGEAEKPGSIRKVEVVELDWEEIPLDFIDLDLLKAKISEMDCWDEALLEAYFSRSGMMEDYEAMDEDDLYRFFYCE